MQQLRKVAQKRQLLMKFKVRFDSAVLNLRLLIPENNEETKPIPYFVMQKKISRLPI
jgi:hypothetical protein